MAARRKTRARKAGTSGAGSTARKTTRAATPRTSSPAAKSRPARGAGSAAARDGKAGGSGKKATGSRSGSAQRTSGAAKSASGGSKARARSGGTGKAPAGGKAGTKTSGKTSARRTSGSRMSATKTAPRETSGRKTGPGKTAGRKTSSGRKTTGGKKPPAGKPARRSGPRSPKARLALAFERFDRLFGSIEPPEDAGTVLEKAIYLVLREGASDQVARKALQSLREEFVDWNEVRVSRPSELARLMSGSGRGAALRRFEDRARRVGEMIDQIYNDKNDPSLEFLAEAKAKEQLEYLEDLDDLGLHNAHALVQWLSGGDKLVTVSPEMAQAASHLGLTDSAAVTKAKKALAEIADPNRLVALTAHLNQLGGMEEDEWPPSLKELRV